MTSCWKCGKTINDLPPKIGFRELCPYCHAYLHCCKNCKNHSPSYSNQCKVPGTDFVSDREANNFCEEFELLGKAPEKKVNPEDVLKRLFKD